ncbi:MAG TPA: LPS export ABC transporter periplasmic protein LptC [Caldithrix abyssi]|uniref:LPS export ABC transporter periplasmic protein LptC n=1 Tax=Caldithrix abyssi TaxID=187145 RepID=A0A7V1PTZ5_CALAY|nr:LPS export ABC transporter periplasmic protein LptC [Caldithrix abyssi]
MMRWLPLLLLLWLAACSEKTPPVTGDDTPQLSLPDQESWNTTLIISYDGRKTGVLKAAHVLKFIKRKKTYIRDSLTVDFFDDMGRHTSVLTARGGEVHDNSQDMIAYGRVVVVSDSGLTLKTDTLRWDNKKKEIISHTPVMFVTRFDTLYGDRFVSDARLENYTISNASGVSYRNFEKEKK